MFDEGVPMRKKGKVPFKVVVGICAALAVVLLVLGIFSIKVVPDGYAGCLYRFGQLQATNLPKGLNFHAPFVETVQNVDIKMQMVEGTANAYTRDSQVIEGIAYTVGYSYDQSKLEYIIRNIGIDNVKTRVLDPNIASIMKDVFGVYKAEVLVQNRSDAQEDIETRLREVCEPYGVYINSFNLVNLDFEDQFEEAVRQKVQMEQDAQKAQNEVELKKAEAEQKVIAAQADADAAKLAADAEAYAIEVIQKQLAQSPNYVELQKVQKWNGAFPQIMGDSINPFVTLDGSRAPTSADIPNG